MIVRRSLLILILAFELPAAAVSNCEENASLPASFIRLLLKIPEAGVEELKIVGENPTPINPFSLQGRRVGTLSALRGIDRALPKLAGTQWEKVRQLARQQIEQMARQHQVASEASARAEFLVARKELISIHSVNDVHTKALTAFTARNGHMYFAHLDLDNRAIVHDEGGNLLWTSSPVLDLQSNRHARPQLALRENRSGQLRLEIISQTKKRGKSVLVIAGYEISSGYALPIKHLDIGDEKHHLIDVVVFPDGRMAFLLRGPDSPFSIFLENGDNFSFWGSTNPSMFAQASDGTIYFLMINNVKNTTDLMEIKNGKMNVVHSGEYLWTGEVFVSRAGRVFINSRDTGKLQEVWPAKKEPIHLGKSRTAVTSFLEADDGRILLARSSEIEDNGNPGDALFDITSGIEKIFSSGFKETDNHGVILTKTKLGVMFVSLKEQSVDAFLLDGDQLVPHGNAGMFRTFQKSLLLRGPNKIYVLHPSQFSFNATTNDYTLHQIFGRYTF